MFHKVMLAEEVMVPVIAARACAEFMTVYRFAADIQCVWMLCRKELFGMDNDVILGAMYANPQGCQFTRTQVREFFTDLYDDQTIF